MIAVIVAHDKGRVIGKNGMIPWNIEGEKSRFRELTTGNVVIMGRRTYDEIGKPLPNRETIVISNTCNYDGPACRTAKSLTEALEMAGDKDIYIAGGQRLYEEALPLADRLYITEIDAEFEGDTYFPEYDKEMYERVVCRHVDGAIPYTYVTLYRKTGTI